MYLLPSVLPSVEAAYGYMVLYNRYVYYILLHTAYAVTGITGY